MYAKNVVLKLGDKTMDEIINDIVNHNKKTHIFMKAPSNYTSQLKNKTFNIRGYKLLYYTYDIIHAN